jgi:hypothetical protein
MHDDAVEVVGLERATFAALLPTGSEHEVIDDQLAPPVEEVGKRLLATGPIEDVLLVYSLSGKLAALTAQFIAKKGELLFFP